MNKELYKLLCCMLPYDVKMRSHNGRTYKLSIKELAVFNVDDSVKLNHKPLLKSQLSYQEELELGMCLIGPSSPKERRWEAAQFLNANHVISYVADVFTAKAAIDFLYSLHYSFGIDKDLFIEKT